jgi:hypothetical protein
MPDTETVAQCAQHLVLIASELRSMGDVDLVLLSEDGVTPCHATLADELWAIAVRLGAPIDGDDRG